jgi:WD40 repeat protein
LWPVAGGKPLGASITLPPVSNCDPLVGVAFSSDGETLAASCYSGNAVLWEIKAGRPRGGPITLPADGKCHLAYGVAFVSRGTLAVGCSNGDTMLWNVVPWATDYASARDRVCRFVWGNLTPGEWNILAPGLAYEAPCPGP